MSRARLWFLAVAVVAAGLLIYACGGSGHSSSTPAPTEPSQPSTPKVVTVMIQDDSFNPKDVVINAGDTVTWVLAGSLFTHTVTADDGSFDSGSIFTHQGASFSQTFVTSGATINYHCKVHQSCCGMQGSVRVGSTAPQPAPGY